jgi:hypothetical protein
MYANTKKKAVVLDVAHLKEGHFGESVTFMLVPLKRTCHTVENASASHVKR